MRADPELDRLTRKRLIEFSGVASVKPITVAKKALGYVNPTVFRWVGGEGARLGGGTLARINQWMDENPGFRRGRAGSRPRQPAPTD